MDDLKALSRVTNISFLRDTQTVFLDKVKAELQAKVLAKTEYPVFFVCKANVYKFQDGTMIGGRSFYNMLKVVVEELNSGSDNDDGVYMAIDTTYWESNYELTIRLKKLWDPWCCCSWWYYGR